MAVIEKRAGTRLSYCATALSVVIAGVLLVRGEDRPREYLASMHINHHAGYGSALACNACHVPSGMLSFQTAMTCSTAKCHAELMPDTSRTEAWQMLEAREGYMPDFEEKAQHYLDLHESAQNMDCIDCHTEHTNDPVVVPQGWETWEEIKRRRALASADGYVSLKDLPKP